MTRFGYLVFGSIVLILALVVGLGWMLTHPGTPEKQSAPVVETAWSTTGTLIRNNPGLVPDTWYLSYEEPGAPGKLAQLAFNASSSCAGLSSCDALTQGQRVTVTGTLSGEVVRVTEVVPAAAEAGQTIKLYYYDAKKDTDARGNVLCSAKGLVAVERILPASATPIDDAVKLLLRGELTPEEKGSGITTEFPLSGVALSSTTQKSGTLTLSFADPEHKTSGGSCRAAILWAQISATAKQFPGITTVRFLPADLFQP